ncbi:HAD family hydrolase [Aquaspirillum soli]
MIASQFRLVVFDWDGTLMDSTAHITRSIQLACQDLGLPIPSRERASHVIGLGLVDALQHACPELKPTQYAEMVAAYRHHYLARDTEVALFDGVEAALAHYQQQPDIFLAVATGKSRMGLDRVLNSTGLDRVFHATRTVDECQSKPHPQMLLELMAYFAVDATETVMIGDTTHDLLMAQHANTHGIGIASGAHPADALQQTQPLACFSSFVEFDQWLRPRLSGSAAATI